MQVLLSCSHTFHQRCLRGFEHFSRSRRCPICRCEGYQTKLISDGQAAYLRHCATLIQAHWRGHAARQRYMMQRVQHRPTQPALWRSWLQDSLHVQARGLREEAQLGGQDLDALFAECDQALAECRPVFARAHAALGHRLPAAGDGVESDDALGLAGSPAATLGERPLSAGCARHAVGPVAVAEGAEVDWTRVLGTFCRRGHSECPICMAALSRGGRRATSLLSCSHAFHSSCIAAFEAFEQAGDGEARRACPVCRTKYSRRTIKAAATGAWDFLEGARASARAALEQSGCNLACRSQSHGSGHLGLTCSHIASAGDASAKADRKGQAVMRGGAAGRHACSRHQSRRRRAPPAASAERPRPPAS